MDHVNAASEITYDEQSTEDIVMFQFGPRPGEVRTGLERMNYQLGKIETSADLYAKCPVFYKVHAVSRSRPNPTQEQLTSVARRGWQFVKGHRNTRIGDNSRMVAAIFAIGADDSDTDYIIMAGIAQAEKHNELNCPEYKSRYTKICDRTGNLFHAEHVAYSVYVDRHVYHNIELPDDLMPDDMFRTGSRVAVFGEYPNHPRGRGSRIHCCWSTCEPNAKRLNLYTSRRPGPPLVHSALPPNQLPGSEQDSGGNEPPQGDTEGGSGRGAWKGTGNGAGRGHFPSSAPNPPPPQTRRIPVPSNRTPANASVPELHLGNLFGLAKNLAQREKVVKPGLPARSQGIPNQVPSRALRLPAQARSDVALKGQSTATRTSHVKLGVSVERPSTALPLKASQSRPEISFQRPSASLPLRAPNQTSSKTQISLLPPSQVRPDVALERQNNATRASQARLEVPAGKPRVSLPSREANQIPSKNQMLPIPPAQATLGVPLEAQSIVTRASQARPGVFLERPSASLPLGASNQISSKTQMLLLPPPHASSRIAPGRTGPVMSSPQAKTTSTIMPPQVRSGLLPGRSSLAMTPPQRRPPAQADPDQTRPARPTGFAQQAKPPNVYLALH